MKLVHYIILAIALALASWLAINGINSNATAQQESQDNKPYQIMVMMDLPANHLRAGSTYSAGYGNARQKAVRQKLGKSIAKKYGLEFVDNWPMPLMGIECFIMNVPSTMKIDELITQLSADKRISWAEPMEDYGVLTSQRTYNDPLYSVSPAGQKWKIADLHSKWTGRNVSIAVVDTQIERNHPDLRGRIASFKNFTPMANSNAELHGTGVAGVIGAKANNGIGIAGIAPNAKLLGLRACWQNKSNQQSICNTLSLARALNYAVEKRVDIINLSLGGPPSRLLSQLIDTANRRNITIVAAYNKKLPSGGFPASHKQVIAVSSDGESYSMSRGFKAPGNGIPTTRPGGKWHLADGSSYAAAHVSGLLALMQECRKTAAKNCRSIATTSNSRFIIDAKASLM